jgi:hypothetical protein
VFFGQHSHAERSCLGGTHLALGEVLTDPKVIAIRLKSRTDMFFSQDGENR